MKKLNFLLLLICLSNLSTLSGQLETIVTGLDVPNGISIYNNSLYFTQAFGDEVNKFDLDDPTAETETLLEIDSPFGTFILGDDLYLGNSTGDSPGLYRLDLLEATPVPELVAEVASVDGIFIQDSVLYLASSIEQSVFSLDLTDEDATLQTIATNFNGATGLVKVANNLYVTEFNGGQVSKIDLTDNSVSTYLTDLDRPNGIALSNGLVYIADNTSINSIDPNEAVPTKTLVVDGLDQTREIAFRGPELYIVEAIGIIGTGRISRFDLPVELPGDSCLIALGIDSLFGGETDESVVSGLYDNSNYSPIGEDAGTECFSFGNPERTVWYRFTGDGNAYTIKTNVEGANNPVAMGDTRIAVYAGNCADLIPIGCNEDEDIDLNLLNGNVNVVTEVGVTYYFFVDAVSDTDPDGGEFRLEITRLIEVSSVPDLIDLGSNIYPNPTDGLLYFQGEIPVRVELVDLAGRSVLASETATNRIDISELPAGVYTLVAQLPTGQWGVTRVMKR